jgi:hypothetical protein
MFTKYLFNIIDLYISLYIWSNLVNVDFSLNFVWLSHWNRRSNSVIHFFAFWKKINVKILEDSQ